MDNHDTKTRSYNMAQIKSKRTKPEEIVAKYLFSKGFRYRRNVKKLPGSPDIVLKKYKTTIFVNGCFWHKHRNCPDFVLPKSNIEYWTNKLDRNVQRDILNYKQLEMLGWNVIIIWECQLKNNKKEITLNDLYFKLRSICER